MAHPNDILTEERRRLLAGSGAPGRGDLLAALAGLGSAEAFRRHCAAAGIGWHEQARLVVELAPLCADAAYYGELLAHLEALTEMAERLAAAEARWSAAGLPLRPAAPLPHGGCGGVPAAPAGPSGAAAPGASGTAGAAPGGGLPTYWLTDAGSRLDRDFWRRLAQGLARLGLIADDQADDLLAFFGAGRPAARLLRPVVFHGSRKQAALLIGLLYGTFACRLEAALRFDGGMLRRLGMEGCAGLAAGLWQCAPLLRTPHGGGLLDGGGTQDPYWQVASAGLRFARGGGLPPAAATPESLRGALGDCRRSLPPNTAAPILCLLRAQLCPF